MANKFTKSVLERQAKEMKIQPAAPVAPAPTAVEAGPVIAEPAPIVELVPVAAVEEVRAEPITEPAPKKTTPAKSIQTPDLTDFIVRGEGRTAKNKTFYLDDSVINAIHRAAIAQKITDSKLVNDIMKKILGI